jgi:hypothetical protein
MFVRPNGDGTPWRYDDFHYERWKPAREAATKSGATKEQMTPHVTQASGGRLVVGRRRPDPSRPQRCLVHQLDEEVRTGARDA